MPFGGHSTSDTRMPSPGRHGSTFTRSNRSLARTCFVHVATWAASAGRSMALTVPSVRVPFHPTERLKPGPGPEPLALVTQSR